MSSNPRGGVAAIFGRASVRFGVRYRGGKTRAARSGTGDYFTDLALPLHSSTWPEDPPLPWLAQLPICRPTAQPFRAPLRKYPPSRIVLCIPNVGDLFSRRAASLFVHNKQRRTLRRPSCGGKAGTFDLTIVHARV